MKVGAFVAVAAVGAAVAEKAYRRWLRARVLTWGATSEEATAPLPGDDLLAAADIVATRAIGIDAPPSAIWPWFVQMGPGAPAPIPMTSSRTCSGSTCTAPTESIPSGRSSVSAT